MEDVRIYDYEFNLLHIEHDIISCNWTLYDNKIGTFEMHFPLTSRLSGIALSRPYLVAVQGSKQAIITGRQADTEGVLYGRSCSWILTRFCIADQFDTDSLYDAGTIAAKDAQTACRYIVNKAMAGVANFVVLTNSTDTFGDVYVENKGVTSAFDLISDCLDKDGAGHEVRFDVKNKRWTFRPSKGAELSVVLSDSNRNTYETEYTEDSQNYYTGGWYEQEMTDMGDWDAEANSPRLTNVQPANFAKAYRVTTAATRFGIAFAEGDYIVCNNKAGTWSQGGEDSELLGAYPVRENRYLCVGNGDHRHDRGRGAKISCRMHDRQERQNQNERPNLRQGLQIRGYGAGRSTERGFQIHRKPKKSRA